jgi:hypothetical protein
MTINPKCEPVPRRDFLQAGLCAGLSLCVASHAQRAVAAQAASAAGAKSAIFISLTGGPSHLDTFDLKPESPAEYRGEFRPIRTNVPGVEFCEHLPKLARCADKFAILRGVSHTLAAHSLGADYVNTGTRPSHRSAVGDCGPHPSYGAVVAQQTEPLNPSDLPPFVAIPHSNQLPGFLGVKYMPLNTGATPRAGQPFDVDGSGLTDGLTPDEVDGRQRLFRQLATGLQEPQTVSRQAEALNRIAQQIRARALTPRARQAFDISRESPHFAQPFGGQPFGTSCLLAVRLVEHGVRFVTLSLAGWDTHQHNFPRLRDSLLPALDTGLAALLQGLAAKGLLESTLVFVTGEFGRTPRLHNGAAGGGRDHYPRCMFMLLAGGGIRGGRVVGRSDQRGTEPDGHGFSPSDVAATFYHCQGIDPAQEYHLSSGGPIAIVRDGRVIRELLS